MQLTLPVFALALLEEASNSSGLPVDQLASLVVMLAAVALGPVMLYLPASGASRLVIPPAIGIAFILVMHGLRGVGIMLAISVVSYALVLMRPHGSPFVITCFVLLTLSGMHLYRLYTDYGGWSIGVETVLMIFTGKYISFAYDVQDGRKLAMGEQLSTKPHEHEQRRERAVPMPTLLEYLSFIFAFWGSLQARRSS